MKNFCQLFLTCEDRAEAEKIAHVLLEKKLIACAKYVPIDCSYWWEGEITEGKEVLVVMESRLDLFDTVEAEVKKIHSYETFVLTTNRVEKVSKKAEKWLNKTLK